MKLFYTILLFSLVCAFPHDMIRSKIFKYDPANLKATTTIANYFRDKAVVTVWPCSFCYHNGTCAYHVFQYDYSVIKQFCICDSFYSGTRCEFDLSFLPTSIKKKC